MIKPFDQDKMPVVIRDLVLNRLYRNNDFSGAHEPTCEKFVAAFMSAIGVSDHLIEVLDLIEAIQKNSVDYPPQHYRPERIDFGRLPETYIGDVDAHITGNKTGDVLKDLSPRQFLDIWAKTNLFGDITRIVYVMEALGMLKPEKPKASS